MSAFASIDDLYQEVILDHNKSPRNRGGLEGATHSAQGHNPFCGDEVTVFLRVENGTVRDIKFEGMGCAISMASASLMTESIKGLRVEEVEGLIGKFRDALTKDESDMDELAEDRPQLKALEGVKEFPVRVKCATLSWHTAAAALRGAKSHSEEVI